MTNEVGYLALPRRMLGLWAEAINQSKFLPIGLLAHGPIFDLNENKAADRSYHRFVGQAGDLSDVIKLYL